MLSIVKSISLHGLEAKVLNVEVDISNGMPRLGDRSDFLMQVLRNQEKELRQQ